MDGTSKHKDFKKFADEVFKGKGSKNVNPYDTSEGNATTKYLKSKVRGGVEERQLEIEEMKLLNPTKAEAERIELTKRAYELAFEQFQQITDLFMDVAKYGIDDAQQEAKPIYDITLKKIKSILNEVYGISHPNLSGRNKDYEDYNEIPGVTKRGGAPPDAKSKPTNQTIETG
jgi:hypothetical protein